MPMVEFVGQSARDPDNIAANPSRLINLYREPVINGGRTRYALKAVPGSADFSGVPGIFVRAIGVVDGVMYVACNGRLYEIDASGGYQDRGAATDGVEASISGNNGLVTLCTGGLYYVWNGSTLTQPTPGAFSAFGSAEYLRNYTILTELGGKRFQWSAIADATTLPGTSFSTADGRDDNNVRAFAIGDLLYLFKETSHEIWYVTGAAGSAAFERQVGGVVDVGLKSFRLITRFDGGAMMVGDDGRAYLVAGGLTPISTPPVETAVRTKAPQSCLTYEFEGHTFLAITFRNAPAWVYDLATGEWHERAQGTDLDPWGASTSAKRGGVWYIGRDGGDILAMGQGNTDGGLPLVREATSRALYVDGSRFTVHEAEFFIRQGFGTVTMESAFSRDGGMTWGPWKQRTLAAGKYDQRVNFRSLGQARAFAAKVRFSQAAEMTMNADVRVRL